MCMLVTLLSELVYVGLLDVIAFSVSVGMLTVILSYTLIRLQGILVTCVLFSDSLINMVVSFIDYSVFYTWITNAQRVEDDRIRIESLN